MKSVDGHIQRLAMDKTHRVEQAAILGLAQAVYGHHSGMLHATGDFGFQQESSSAGRVAGHAVVDELDRHVAFEQPIFPRVHDAQSAFGMEPETGQLGFHDQRLIHFRAAHGVFPAGLSPVHFLNDVAARRRNGTRILPARVDHPVVCGS